MIGFGLGLLLTIQIFHLGFGWHNEATFGGAPEKQFEAAWPQILSSRNTKYVILQPIIQVQPKSEQPEAHSQKSEQQQQQYSFYLILVTFFREFDYYDAVKNEERQQQQMMLIHQQQAAHEAILEQQHKEEQIYLQQQKAAQEAQEQQFLLQQQAQEQFMVQQQQQRQQPKTTVPQNDGDSYDDATVAQNPPSKTSQEVPASKVVDDETKPKEMPVPDPLPIFVDISAPQNSSEVVVPETETVTEEAVIETTELSVQETTMVNEQATEKVETEAPEIKVSGENTEKVDEQTSNPVVIETETAKPTETVSETPIEEIKTVDSETGTEAPKIVKTKPDEMLMPLFLAPRWPKIVTK